jgi:hypothetical protein
VQGWGSCRSYPVPEPGRSSRSSERKGVKALEDSHAIAEQYRNAQRVARKPVPEGGYGADVQKKIMDAVKADQPSFEDQMRMARTVMKQNPKAAPAPEYAPEEIKAHVADALKQWAGKLKGGAKPTAVVNKPVFREARANKIKKEFDALYNQPAGTPGTPYWQKRKERLRALNQQLQGIADEGS